MTHDTPTKMIKRKNDHIEICLSKNVESLQHKPFQNVRLKHSNLPEIDFKTVNTEQTFCGFKFDYPLLITGMTGGVERGQTINETLAKTAEKWGIPMGLGSQKLVLKDARHRHLFDVRKVAPKVFLIGNIGAVSFNYGVTTDDILSLIEIYELNAFAIHVNALQECIQPEGEKNFSQLLPKIEHIVRNSPVPIIIKEVGNGLGLSSFQRLLNCGVRTFDVGGAGGTSWSVVEGERSDTLKRRLGEVFRNWGLSTEESLRILVSEAQKQNVDCEFIATGGMRDGLQAAKAIAMGAQMVGFGLPLFRAAVSHDDPQVCFERVDQEMEFLTQSLRIAQFCTGSQNLAHLKTKIMAADSN